MKRRIFLDASFWIAWRDDDDLRHARAATLLDEIEKLRAGFVSSTLVFAEVHAHFSREPEAREKIIADFWENPLMQLEIPTYADHRAAVELLRGYDDKEFSFCDALSFVIMRRLKIIEAAALDDHFHQIGEFKVWN
jgi:predicted nucleic acid-binding protein